MAADGTALLAWVRYEQTGSKGVYASRITLATGWSAPHPFTYASRAARFGPVTGWTPVQVLTEGGSARLVMTADGYATALWWEDAGERRGSWAATSDPR